MKQKSLKTKRLATNSEDITQPTEVATVSTEN